jgi:hypothetical protein
MNLLPEYTEDKYFKPAMTDLVFGCEIYIKHANDDNRMVVLTYGPGAVNAMDYTKTTEGTVTYHVPDFWFMRYLTADIIESIGFNRLPHAPFQHSSQADMEVHWFQNEQWVVSFVNETRMLGIFVYTLEGRYGLYFSGVCRDINRFKLLFEMVTSAAPSGAVKEQQKQIGH